MNRLLSMLVLTLVTAAGCSADPPGARYNIGRPATEEQVVAAAVSVFPNGSGLPPGQGTAQQGTSIYAARCAACHGDQGEGHADFPALVGGRDSLGTANPVLTIGSYWPHATTVFDYIRRAMPYESPGSLNDDEVYALTAWILARNGIVSEETVIDRNTLPKVVMPNRGGFIPDPRPDVAANETATITPARPSGR